MTSWKKPTDLQVDRAVALMMGSWEKYRYFFERLDNPEWVAPLRSRRFFRSPPGPLEQGDQISFPVWPESRYLSRVAAEAPNLVLEIIKDMRATKNFRVHQDLLEAASRMPPDKGSQIVPLAKLWLDNEYVGLVPEQAGELMLRLAEGGQTRAALTVLQALTEPTLREIPLDLGEGKTVVSRQTKPRYSPWYLKRLIENDLPAAAARDPLAIAKVLDKQLRKCVRMERRFGHGSDGSHVWRPAIETHPQNWGEQELKVLLTVGLRDALELAAHEQTEDLRTTLERYTRDPLSIFRRLALHIVRVSTPAYQDLVCSILGDDLFACDQSVHHEYYLLLETQFPELPEVLKKRILDRIEEGPELERYRRTAESVTGSPPCDEDIDGYRRHWQLQRLTPLAAALTGEWKRTYEVLLAECGRPEHPESLMWSSATWVGPTSPKNRDELANMAPTDVLKYVKAFEPTDEFFDHSREGLGRELQTVVEEDPARYLAVANRFVEEQVHPTYAYHLVTGLHEAWKKGADLDWETLLGFFTPISKALTGESEQLWDATVTIDDVDWPGVRMTISRFLAGALARDDRPLPARLMPTIRDVLLRLIHDPDPTPEDEETRVGGAMDWPSVRLNVARGVAALALLEYALRYARLQKAEHEAEVGEQGHEQRMEPSVKAAFTDMLDKEKEPSVAVHSLFGEFLPNFLFLDRDWTVAHLDQIFPSQSERRPYWESAWQGYMLYCPRVHRELYELLHPQYLRALRAVDLEDSSRATRNATHRIASHIAVAYAVGFEELEAGPGKTTEALEDQEMEQSLLSAFLDTASGELRGVLARALGPPLDPGKEVSPAQWARLRQYWQARTRAAAGALGDPQMDQELSAFVSWLSGVPEGLDTLHPLLGPSVERLATGHDAHVLLEYLSDQSESHPLLATEMLRLLLDRQAILEQGPDMNRIYLIGAQQSIWTILENAMGADDAAGASAASLINLLGKRGDHVYRELLQPRA